MVLTKIIHVHANMDKCNQSTSIKQAKLTVNAHKDDFGLNSFCNFGNFTSSNTKTSKNQTKIEVNYRERERETEITDRQRQTGRQTDRDRERF